MKSKHKKRQRKKILIIALVTLLAELWEAKPIRNGPKASHKTLDENYHDGFSNSVLFVRYILYLELLVTEIWISKLKAFGVNPESWRTNNQEKKCFADFRWILRDRVEDGRGGGGGVWLSHNKIYLIPPPHPSRLCSLLMMIPPHWKTISYSPPFMLCQRRLIPTPFPVKTMQPPPPPPRQKLGSWDTGKTKLVSSDWQLKDCLVLTTEFIM